MADEITTHNKEMLSICFRCVDQNEAIRELFLEFLELEESQDLKSEMQF